jgi:thiazole synthase
MSKPFSIGDTILSSRLFLGTAGYPSPEILRQSIEAARPGLITVSLRRENAAGNGQKFWDILKSFNIPVLPNTAGCHSAAEAITTAEMAREVFETNRIKLEVIGDDYTLQPDPYGLLEAAKILINKGFEVYPYMTDDLILAQRLADSGCNILMPWGAPIGSGRGLNNPYALKLLRQRFPDKTLVVDAGLGAPSHAAAAMEMGYDAVLLNTAAAKAADPVAMARAFALAVEAGHSAYVAGIIAPQEHATPSTPLIDKPFWHQNTG